MLLTWLTYKRRRRTRAERQQLQQTSKIYVGTRKSLQRRRTGRRKAVFRVVPTAVGDRHDTRHARDNSRGQTITTCRREIER